MSHCEHYNTMLILNMLVVLFLLTTSITTRSPTKKPTAPTSSPITHAPTTTCESSHVECHNAVIYPQIGSITSETINIRSMIDTYNKPANYYLTWNIVENRCYSPSLTLTNKKNFDGGHGSGYLYVYHNTTKQSECPTVDPNYCVVSICLNNVAIPSIPMIDKNKAFVIRLETVNNEAYFCSPGYTLYADVTLRCNSVPTPSPTFSPTNTPSTSPTLPPTASPSYAPSDTPSYSPTAAPTRGPTTMNNNFTTLIPITYQISNLTKPNIYYIVENTENVVNSIQEIIEQNYFQKETLEYNKFWVNIQQVNDKSIKEEETLSTDDFDIYYLQKPMILDAVIETNNIDSGFFIIVESRTKTFIDSTTKQLQSFLDNNYLHFMVLHTDTLKPISKYPSKPKNDRTMIIISIVLLSIGGITSFCVFLSNKNVFFKTSVDNANYKVPMLFALQVYDLLSDINLAYEICSKTGEYDGTQVGSVLFWCAVGSVVTVVLPFVSNLVYSASITNQESIQNNKKAVGYFAAKTGVLVAFTAVCGGCFPALLLVSSRIGGYDVFSCGLTRYELDGLVKIKMTSTVTMENLPQLLIQMIYAVKTKELTPALFLAFIGSVLSIVIVVAAWYGNRLIRKESDIISYFLVFEHKNKDIELTQDQIESIRKNKGKKGRLEKILARQLRIAHKYNLDIGYISTTKLGLEVYISHYIATTKRESVALEDDPMKFLNDKFYKAQKDGVNDIFRKQFGGNGDQSMAGYNNYVELNEQGNFNEFFVTLRLSDAYVVKSGYVGIQTEMQTVVRHDMDDR